MTDPKPSHPAPDCATNSGPAAVAVAAPAAGLAAAPHAIAWPSAARQAAFEAWLAPLVATHGLQPESLRPASADASFRRYLRLAACRTLGVDSENAPQRDQFLPDSPPHSAAMGQEDGKKWAAAAHSQPTIPKSDRLLDRAAGGSCIVMDAPPELEDCRPFVHVQALMAAAGLRVPQILAWDEAGGFMLLSDLGAHTLIEALAPAAPAAAQAWYLQAVDVLIEWQKASRPGVLPAYDEALLRRELALFPDWYVARHRGIQLDEAQQNTLARTFDAIVAHNLAAPSVFVHRDFMPRNLMLPTAEGESLGVLDFQDAVYGPITYDIASLLRDAFISWDEEFVIDVTVRYWEKARRAGLLGAASASGWGADFGEFYRSVEWMGLQRHLKVAGIFARLTLRDGKPKYLADAPRFIAYIRATASRYRELAPLLRLIDQIEGVQEQSGWAFGRVS